MGASKREKVRVRVIENVKNRKVEINKRLDHGKEEESVCKKI